MKIQVASDLHLEFQRDQGIWMGNRLRGFFTEDDVETDAEVLVLAGDVGNLRSIWSLVQYIKNNYKLIVYVHGNHELYGCNRATLRRSLEKLQRQVPNFRWLHNDVVGYKGILFAGTTLWFPHTPEADMYQQGINDFRLIPGLRKWVYDENEKAVKFLHYQAQFRPDVVITHHAPSYQSIHPRFRGDNLNCYYITNMENYIAYDGPQLWVHGHTHDSFDYMAGDTRVVCNPFGYAFDMVNPNWEPVKVIDVEPRRKESL